MRDPPKEEPGGLGLGLDRSQSNPSEVTTRDTMLLANSESPRLADGSVERQRQAEQAYVVPATTPHPREAGGPGAPGLTGTGTAFVGASKTDVIFRSTRHIKITDEDVARAQASANATPSSLAEPSTPTSSGTLHEVPVSAASGGSGGLSINNEVEEEGQSRTRTGQFELPDAGRGKRPHDSPDAGVGQGDGGQDSTTAGAATEARRVEPAGGRSAYDIRASCNTDVFLRG